MSCFIARAPLARKSRSWLSHASQIGFGGATLADLQTFAACRSFGDVEDDLISPCSYLREDFYIDGPPRLLGLSRLVRGTTVRGKPAARRGNLLGSCLPG